MLQSTGSSHPHSSTLRCLQLLLSAQQPFEHGGLHGGAVYICTERCNTTKRLRQLAEERKFPGVYGSDPLQNIFIKDFSGGPEELESTLEQASGLIGSRKDPPIRLLIVDSIAFPFKDELGHSTHPVERSHALYRISCVLKRIAHRRKVVVLTTNHVIDFVDRGDLRRAESAVAQAGSPAALVSSNRMVLPSLGVQWATSVNMRIFIGKHSSVQKEGSAIESERELRLVFAPHIPPCTEDNTETRPHVTQAILRSDGFWALYENDENRPP